MSEFYLSEFDIKKQIKTNESDVVIISLKIIADFKPHKTKSKGN